MSSGLKTPGWMEERGCRWGPASVMVESMARAPGAVTGASTCLAGGQCWLWTSMVRTWVWVCGVFSLSLSLLVLFGFEIPVRITKCFKEGKLTLGA